MKHKKRVYINAGIKLLSKSEVLQYISTKVYDRIKAQDVSPMFAMFSIGYEGECKGALYTDNIDSREEVEKWYKQLWPLKAVKQLISLMKATKHPPIYEAHAIDDTPRDVVGSIIASTKKTINGIIHAVGIGYINNYGTREKILDGTFDTCSLEANCVFEEADNLLRYIVRDVQEFFGIALCNSKVNPPGFDDARILAVVNAMAKRRDDDDDDDDDYKHNYANRKRRTDVVSLRDVKEFVETNSISPTTLYSVETLTKVPAVSGAFDSTFQEKLKEKVDAISKLEDELKPLRVSAKNSKVVDLIKKSDLLKDEYKEVVEYLTKTLKLDLGDDDDSQGTVDKAIKAQLEIMKDANFKTKGSGKKQSKDDKGDKDDNKSNDKPDEDDTDEDNDKDDSGKVDYTNPKFNKLIPA